jgi:hypothetical protein
MQIRPAEFIFFFHAENLTDGSDKSISIFRHCFADGAKTRVLHTQRTWTVCLLYILYNRRTEIPFLIIFL